MPNVIDRVKAQEWFKAMQPEEQQATVESLLRDPHAQERVEQIFDNLDNDSSWRNLSRVQQQAQILGVIDQERSMRREREALEELAWYEDLGPDDQVEVRSTVEMNARIKRASARTVRKTDEKQIQTDNPWHHVLRQGRA